MKIMHIADLHFGKSLKGYSLREDQRDWGKKFLEKADEEKPDAIVIAGDIYDRSAPNDEAVDLMDWFFTELAKREAHVFVVSGNHDSGHKISFMSEVLSKNRIHIAGKIKAEMEHVTLNDEFGPVTFWMMPYIFPAALEGISGEESRPKTYEDAARMYIAMQDMDFSQRNVIVAHQLVTANGFTDSILGGSESVIGGVGNIPADVFEGFDYVALGHIHKAQTVGKETVRYAGSPLCYHFDEIRFPDKGPVVIELPEKGSEPEIHVDLIEPEHRLIEIKGSYREIMSAKETGIYRFTDDEGKEAEEDLRGRYVKAVITDENPETGARDSIAGMIEAYGGRLLETSYMRRLSSAGRSGTDGRRHENKALDELFCEFLEGRDRLPDKSQKAIIGKLTEILENTPSDDYTQASDKGTDRLVNFILDMEDDE